MFCCACTILECSLGSANANHAPPSELLTEKCQELQLTEEHLCQAKAEIKKVRAFCANKRCAVIYHFKIGLGTVGIDVVTESPIIPSKHPYFQWLLLSFVYVLDAICVLS